VGYSSRLVYDNMGSLLTFMFLQPVSLILAYFTLWALKYTKKYPRLVDSLRHTLRDKIDGFHYNGLIAFYSTNYLVLSVIGNITRKEFGKNDSLNFSSLISWLLTVFSVLFPLILTFMLGRKYVPESLSKEDKSLRSKFLTTYGSILKGYKEHNIGKWLHIVSALSQMYKEFFCWLAVT